MAGGRDAEILETAIHAESDKELQERLIEQRKQFESAIQNYVGDDPLELWYEYIQWVEQSYPRSGKETALTELLSKCLNQFENDERYNQDRRMVKLYIRYVSFEVLLIIYYLVHLFKGTAVYGVHHQVLYLLKKNKNK